ncbi:MAG: hypothetical protein AB7G75_09800 [Candidatus Binatia bacterium]
MEDDRNTHRSETIGLVRSWAKTERQEGLPQLPGLVPKKYPPPRDVLQWYSLGAVLHPCSGQTPRDPEEGTPDRSRAIPVYSIRHIVKRDSPQSDPGE